MALVAYMYTTTWTKTIIFKVHKVESFGIFLEYPTILILTLILTIVQYYNKDWAVTVMGILVYRSVYSPCSVNSLIRTHKYFLVINLEYSKLNITFQYHKRFFQNRCVRIAIFIFFNLINQPVCIVRHRWPKIRCGRDYIFFYLSRVRMCSEESIFICHPCTRFSHDFQARRWPKLFTWLQPFASFVELGKEIVTIFRRIWYYYNFFWVTWQNMAANTNWKAEETSDFWTRWRSQNSCFFHNGHFFFFFCISKT